jgi:peptidoglycan/LPS O-acetylase OafA/YrhL
MMQHNGVGVLLFFAISGYVLALPFANTDYTKTISLRNYYLRRLVRIEPPYFIVMTAIFLLYVFTDSHNLLRYGPHYAASMVYAHNLLLPADSGLNAVAWSLEIEVQFYLLAPLFFRVFLLSAQRRNALLAVGIILFSILPLLWNPGVRTLYSYVSFFLIGVLLAGLRQDGLFHARLTRTVWLVSTGAAIAACAALGPLGYILPQKTYELITPLCIAAVMTAALAPTPVRRLFCWSPLAIIGGMCYSIYLTHSLLLAGATGQGWYPSAGEPSWWAFAVASLVLCSAVLATGAVVYKMLEQPFMRLSARYRLRTPTRL